MESKPLNDAPEGISIFVDTNVLIYHPLEDEIYGASCRNFHTSADIIYIKI